MNKEAVNIYIVPNEKNKSGGKFYNIYLNRKEKIDLKEFYHGSLEEMERNIKKKDPTFKKTGGLILRRKETIESFSSYILNEDGVLLDPKEQQDYSELKTYLEISLEQGEALEEQMKEFSSTQKKIKSLKRKLKKI